MLFFAFLDFDCNFLSFLGSTKALKNGQELSNNFPELLQAYNVADKIYSFAIDRGTNLGAYIDMLQQKEMYRITYMHSQS